MKTAQRTAGTEDLNTHTVHSKRVSFGQTQQPRSKHFGTSIDIPVSA